jgi:hypothetical protein
MSKQKLVVVLGDDNTPKSEMLDEITLEYLQTSVKGWVQAVNLQGAYEGITIWVNEEGKFDDSLSLNTGATFLWSQSFGYGTDFIVGNAVFTGGADENGDTLGLSYDQAAFIFSSLLLANAVGEHL